VPRETRNIYTSSTTTRVLAAFYTDEENGLNIDEPVRSDPRLGKIIGFNYTKSLGQAAGSWTLTIKKPRQTPQSLLQKGPEGLWRDPEDVWVRIKVSVDGQIVDTVLGLVDSVGEDTVRTGSGTRSETYTISGRDIGKIFEVTPLFVNFFHDPSRPLRSQGNITATFAEQLVGTPAHFVRVLVEVWLGNDGTAEVPWVLPSGLGGGPFFSPNLPVGGGSFQAKLSLEGPGLVGLQQMDGQTNGEAIAPTLMQIDQGGGKLWDTMQEYANPIMNEMFVDLAPIAEQEQGDFENLVPTLTLRERPFPTHEDAGRSTSASKWNRLMTHTLALGDVKRRQIHKGGAANRFNYWKIRLNGIGAEGFNVDELLQRGVDGVESGRPGNIPIFNTDSIARHGVRPYTATTRFVPFFYRSRASQEDGESVREEEELQGTFFRLVAAWLKKLHDWYVIAPFELSGTLSTNRMQPEIRIGQRLREERDEGVITYYIETFSHSWTYPNDGQSTFTVTRGEYEGDDLLDFVYEQYENPRASTAQEACLVSAGTGEAGDDADTTELLEQLAAGCRFATVEGEDESLELTDNPGAAGGTTQLEIERDGREARPPSDDALVGEDTVLDDSLPEVGSTDEIPPVDAPADPTDTQGQLERQEPLQPIEGLDDLESFGGDPLGGLDLTGTET
jgi:hypothetical protein